MRLLHTANLQVETFVENAIPLYAILSHTWEDEEVSFQDIQQEGIAQCRRGFQKLLNSCRIAASGGYGYIWIDTCCIDKTSSAELSEAINSMYRWYKNAGVCYAYLADVSAHDIPEDKDSEFRKSRWFTRGWTLQELLAPDELVFYSEDWSPLGTKSTQKSVISQTTRIEEDVLEGEDLSTICIAKKMAWASLRQTTMSEDIAYCLMGIFDINMPLLYGEGNKAFMRLQEEILRGSDDESIFAWEAPIDLAKRTPYHGLLASSPSYFSGSHRFDHPNFLVRPSGMATSMTNKGLHVELLLMPYQHDEADILFFALLNCKKGRDDIYPGILLQRLSVQGFQFARVDAHVIVSLNDKMLESRLSTSPGHGPSRPSIVDIAKLRRIFVRQTPRPSLPVSGFCYPPDEHDTILGTGCLLRLVEVYPKSQWVKTPSYILNATASQIALEDSRLEDMSLQRTSLQDSTNLGDGVIRKAQVRVEAVGALRFKLCPRSSADNHFDQQFTLIVGFERSKNPLETLPGYVRPWYSFASGDRSLGGIFKSFKNSERHPERHPERQAIFNSRIGARLGVSLKEAQAFTRVLYQIEIKER